jgi:hypothetical protein
MKLELTESELETLRFLPWYFLVLIFLSAIVYVILHEIGFFDWVKIKLKEVHK